MSAAEAPSVTFCANDRAVWPWQAEPYRLWSLLDMTKSDIGALIEVAKSLGEMAGVAGASLRGKDVTFVGFLPIETGESKKKQKGRIRTAILVGLSRAIPVFQKSELPPRFSRKLEKLKANVEQTTSKSFKAKVVAEKLKDFFEDLVEELEEQLFLNVDHDKREMYEQNRPPFGPEVETKFPKSRRDISAASRCYALDEWTACVFHLMRALEAPLHLLADEIGHTFPTPLDLEGWASIVDHLEARINKQIKDGEKTTRSHERNERLKFLSEAVIPFRHFRHAWRNDAAHGRDWYDEKVTTPILNAVTSFMQHLAREI